MKASELKTDFDHAVFTLTSPIPLGFGWDHLYLLEQIKLKRYISYAKETNGASLTIIVPHIEAITRLIGEYIGVSRTMLSKEMRGSDEFKEYVRLEREKFFLL